MLLGLISASAELSVEKPLAERLAALSIQAQLAAAGNAQDASSEDLADMAAAQAGFMLVGLVGQGILIDDGDTYSTEISFDDTGATVNGTPMPFGLP